MTLLPLVAVVQVDADDLASTLLLLLPNGIMLERGHVRHDQAPCSWAPADSAVGARSRERAAEISRSLEAVGADIADS